MFLFEVSDFECEMVGELVEVRLFSMLVMFEKFCFFRDLWVIVRIGCWVFIEVSWMCELVIEMWFRLVVFFVFWVEVKVGVSVSVMLVGSRLNCIVGL